MADFIKKILTADGPKQIDYNSLANLPDLSSLGSGGGTGEGVSEITYDMTYVDDYHLDKGREHCIDIPIELRTDGVGTETMYCIRILIGRVAGTGAKFFDVSFLHKFSSVFSVNSTFEVAPGTSAGGDWGSMIGPISAAGFRQINVKGSLSGYVNYIAIGDIYKDK